MESPVVTGSQPHAQTHQNATQTSRTAQNTAKRQKQENKIGSTVVSSDLWSDAYREAIDRLGNDLDVAILMGGSVAQLFRRLEEMNKDATQESAFLRGIAYLHSIQVPLEKFKLALDLAAPLSKLDPTATATTVCGVLSSVTAVSIFPN